MAEFLTEQIEIYRFALRSFGDTVGKEGGEFFDILVDQIGTLKVEFVRHGLLGLFGKVDSRLNIYKRSKVPNPV